MHKQRLDAFGKVVVGGQNLGNFRVMDTGPTTLTLFASGDPITITTLELSEEFKTKARRLFATTTSGQAIEFTRAGCSCQTPTSLQGHRNKFLSLLAPADA